MTIKQKAKLKKEIRKIFEESGVESRWSTHSELADYILDEIRRYEN